MLQKKLLGVSLVTMLVIAQGCGHNATGQTTHTSDTNVQLSISPAPPVAMQSEQATVEFDLNSDKPTPVQNVTASFSMPDMAMDDMISLSEISPGKFQGSYRFSMAGKWTEKITFTKGGKAETVTVSWNVGD